MLWLCCSLDQIFFSDFSIPNKYQNISTDIQPFLGSVSTVMFPFILQSISKIFYMLDFIYYFLPGMYFSDLYTHLYLWKSYPPSEPISNATSFISKLSFLNWIPCFPSLFCLSSIGISLAAFNFILYIHLSYFPS